ncbi:MAG: methyltransferase domain-containing protein [Caulobacterales bacterium]
MPAAARRALQASPTKACAVCKGTEADEVYRQSYASIAGLGDVNYDHRIVICSGCGLVYANPPPSEELIASYYRDLSNYENPQRQGKASLGDEGKWNRTCEIVAARFPRGFRGQALEIGCATATGLSHFKQRGWSVTVVDPSPKAAAIAKDLYDIEVVVGMFDPAAVRERGPFDLIVLSHVVEHLVEPDVLLGRLGEVLKPGGLVYIEVPNLLRPYVPMGYFMFEHLSYFTPKTLTLLMEGCGFMEDQVATFDNGADIEPFYPVIAATYWHAGDHKAVPVGSDYDAALAAVEGYKEKTGAEIARLQSRIDSIYRQLAGQRLALWGGGLHTSQLLSMVRLAGAPPVCIFDNDAKKQGLALDGVEIVAPQATAADYQRLTDAILISSRASEDEIWRQIAWLEAHGIRVFRLYAEP